MKLKEILNTIEQEITEELLERRGDPSRKQRRSAVKRKDRKRGKRSGAGGPKRVDAKSKGTVGKVHKRKLKNVAARDAKAEKMFNAVADGGKQGKRVVKQAQKLAGAQGQEWPAGVWAIATDKTIRGNKSVPKRPKKGGGSSTAPGTTKKDATKAQNKAVKAVNARFKNNKGKRRMKTSKDPNQLDLFKDKD